VLKPVYSTISVSNSTSRTLDGVVEPLLEVVGLRSCCWYFFVSGIVVINVAGLGRFILLGVNVVSTGTQVRMYVHTCSTVH
jgi:hypothetical protein